MSSTEYPAQPFSPAANASGSSPRLPCQAELEYPVELLLGVVLHRLEEEGRLEKSDLAIRVEEFKTAGRTEQDGEGASRSGSLSSSKTRGVHTLSVHTHSRDLLLRMFDRSCQDNGRIDSKATIRLMDILRTSHQTPASSTSSRSSLWGRPNQLSLSYLVPEVFGAYHAYDDGFKRPWILMERPRGQVLSDLLSSTSRSAQTLQDRLQLARALARFQAAIWAVSPAPFTCPDSTRAAIPPLSLGRPFVPREEEGLMGTGRSTSPSLLSNGIHTSSSSFAYSYIRESPPGTPASSSHSDDGGRSPPAPSCSSPSRCPLTTRIVAGLRLQQTRCQESWQGITQVARLDDLVQAAEILLSESDADGDVDKENGLDFDSSIKGWERTVGRQQCFGTVPEYVLSLPRLGPENIFVEEVPDWTPDLLSFSTTSRTSSSILPLTPGLPATPFAASPPSKSWTVTGLSELDIAHSEPAPLAFLSAVSSSSIWAQILLSLPVEPDYGPSRPLTDLSWNELEMEQQQQPPTKKKEQPKEPKEPKKQKKQKEPKKMSEPKQQPKQQQTQQGPRQSKRQRRSQKGEGASPSATTPAAGPSPSRQQAFIISHGQPAGTAEKSKKIQQQQQQGNKRRRSRKEAPDATTSLAAASAASSSSSQQQAHNESDDESDVGFEFEPEDYRKRKRSWASSSSSYSSSFPPFDPTVHPSPPPHHQTRQEHPLLQAFYAELSHLVPSFDRTCKRALANKLPELLRLAQVDRFGEADGDGDGTRVGGAEEERMRDEEVVLAAAKDRLRRREERAAAAARVTGLSLLSSFIPHRNAS